MSYLRERVIPYFLYVFQTTSRELDIFYVLGRKKSEKDDAMKKAYIKVGNWAAGNILDL